VQRRKTFNDRCRSLKPFRPGRMRSREVKWMKAPRWGLDRCRAVLYKAVSPARPETPRKGCKMTMGHLIYGLKEHLHDRIPLPSRRPPGPRAQPPPTRGVMQNQISYQ
jgi:hypothetical protein